MNSRQFWQTAIIAVGLAAMTCASQAQSNNSAYTVVRTQNNSPVTVYSAAGSKIHTTRQNSNYAPIVTAWGYDTDDKRVDLDLNRASLKDALRQLCDQAKREYT